jgi:type II secretory pathway predicted ATPase ExeA
MYEEHFGLRARPFRESVDPSQYVGLPGRDAVLRRLRYGLERGPGPVLVFGPPGSGKSLLTRVLAQEMAMPLVALGFPAMPADELIAFLADELGAPAAVGTGLAVSVRRVRAALAEAVARGRRPLVVVDDVHLIGDPGTFEALRLLLNFTTAGAPDLALVLAGGPEFLLRLPPAFADRLTAQSLLGPLDEAEAAAYLEGRLALAGASERLFDAPTVAALHRAADGLPRRLNRLADLALLIAYARDQERPDPATIATAALEAGYDALAA